MTFQETLQSDMTSCYANMLTGSTMRPFDTQPKIEVYDNFERLFANYHGRLERERNEFNSSLSQIIRKRDSRIRAENDEECRRREKADHIKFLCVEWVKTIVFNIPTIALFIVSLVLLGDPSTILENIHFGWIIGIYVGAFVISIVVAGVVVGKSNHYGNAYKFVKQRCAIMIAGAFTFIVLMSLGLGFAPSSLL